MFDAIDVCVVGGSLGGVMAAFQAAKNGLKVVLIEETDWIGGQLTSQAVPPDEHPWIEKEGCTETYRQFRNDIREKCRCKYIYKKEQPYDYFNPGLGWVTRLAHEPVMALEWFQELLEKYIVAGNLKVLLNTKVISAQSSETEVFSVRLSNDSVIEASYFIDGTDEGDLFPLVGESYRLGSDGNIFDESLANVIKDEEDLQPVTWVAALEWMPDKQPVIPKPDLYDFFEKEILPIKEENTRSLLSWYGPDSTNMVSKKFEMFESPDDLPLWSYRRIFTPSNLEEPKDIRGNLVKNYSVNHPVGDIMLLNWPQNDYIFGNLLGQNRELNSERVKQLTLSLVYWLQTKGKDGITGYENIRLCPEVLGSPDGLAKAAYIREGRRLDSEFVVRQGDLQSHDGSKKVARFEKSVGVGSYHLDLHMTTKSKRFLYAESLPFEIPMGIMISKKIRNLIPASKNVGTTHITNSCFRLHPVEWNIGEVAGICATFAIQNHVTPQEIYHNEKLFKAFEDKLIRAGIQLHWNNL